MIRHRDVSLGAKILHDHFLDVSVFFMHRADGHQRVNPFFHGFANPDQDSSRKRDRALPRLLDGAQPQRRNLVGRIRVGQSVAHQSHTNIFQHQTDAGV